MLKSLGASVKPKTSSPYRHSLFLNKDFLPPAEHGDAFEVRIRAGRMSPELFAKVHKSMRSNVEQRASNKGSVELFQRFTQNDIDKLHALDKKIAMKAYLEGVYVAERYCVLVHPEMVPNKINAERIMEQYLEYIKRHRNDHDYNEELQWIVKDYAAGTAGEDVRADAALLKRARRFYARLRALDHSDGVESRQKKIEHVVKSDINPLAAFVALRRVFFAM